MMGFFSFGEVVENYARNSIKKATNKGFNLFLLAILAGMLIAFAALAASIATHTVTDVGMSKVLSGLFFPFGLAMIVFTGAELFTGNCLMTMGFLDKRISLSGFLRNLVIVYFGNFVGAFLIAAISAFFGVLNYSGGLLAVSAMKTAVAKSTMPFANGFMQGILCNILVCLAVLFAQSGKDVTGRITGGYVPICVFVICGFPHCIADMFYVPLGLLARISPAYAGLAVQAGVDLSHLTWGNYIVRSMVPVTLGNIIGGVAISILAWYIHLRGRETVKA
ncbi:MAG: formate/nitrite transporter family protein [Oscillospiraceae bacterium]|nr:formate/nitrite transporter family protein [Oscillospiraceae bacterium]